MSELDEALDRLGRYNNGRYHPETNPFGHSGKGGTLANWVRSGKDAVTLYGAIAALWNSINFVAERGAVAAILQQAQALVAQITAGSTSALAFPSLDKSLLTATDIVDVFVYDARLDDRLPGGGRWNEPGRMAHTSWWNEPLNTATRGAKRDFPLVALIVAQAAKVTIFDALDLDPVTGVPRMWMVFNGTTSPSSAVFADAAVPIKGVYAANGRLWVATGGAVTGALCEIAFTSDRALVLQTLPYLYRGPLSARNNALGVTQTSLVGGIVANACNAVHARVMPGAPLDAVGLPVPTVLVASAGGASIVHPSGQVANLTDAFGIPRCVILADGRVALSRGDQLVLVGPVPYATATGAAWAQAIHTTAVAPAVMLHGAGNPIAITDGAEGGAAGVTFRAQDAASPANGMVAYATTSYATGWQPGDIRLATLCDAAAGSITGSGDLVGNPGPFSTTSGYAGTSATLSVAAGELVVTQAGTLGSADFSVATVAGQTYVVTMTARRGTAGNVFAQVRDAADASQLDPGTMVFTSASATTLICQFVARSAMSVIRLYSNGVSGQTAVLAGLSVKLAVPDRSYKAKGMAVAGTLQRTAVTTGADVVAWSGFSASNYLEQPYNADLDFGAGDFWFRAWASATNGNQCLFQRATKTTAAGAGVYGHLFIGGIVRLGINDGAGGSIVCDGTIAAAGQRVCIDMVRRGGMLELWVDGVRLATQAGAYNLTNTNAVLRIGSLCDGTAPFSAGDLTLFRAGAYAPTPGQIRRMYQDEMQLVTAGAACLIGGTSASVQKLDRDPLTERLLVCTPSGSSIFRGLVRVAYHTSSTITSATSNTHRSGSLRGGVLLVGTAAQAATYQDAIGGKEAIAAEGYRPAPQPCRARGVTTDATPTDLAPRVWIGERELVVITATVLGRVYGAADGQRSKYVRRATYYRDAGGSVTLQGSVEVIGGDQEVTATADATLNIDASAQTVSVRVTGVAATRIHWAADIQIHRISEDQSYA